jgi:cobalt transport protein
MKSEYYARARLSYLVTLSSLLFFVHDIAAIAAITVAQLLLFGLSVASFSVLFRACRRLFFLCVIIFISYLFVPIGEEFEEGVRLSLGPLALTAYPQGLEVAAVMVLRIVALIVVSIWARETSTSEGFIAALRWFRMPETVAIAIDAGLHLSSRKKNKPGSGGGGGNGGGRHRKFHGGGQGQQGADISYREIRAGRMGFMESLLQRAHVQATTFLRQNYAGIKPDVLHDAGVIVTVVVAAMSLKLLQLLPGLPIAPGHKNLVVVPLLVIAVLLTRSRWGGLQAGLAVGVASFMLGYGKFGFLEVAHFALPGWVADLLAPLLVRRLGPSLWLRFALLGAIIGLTRFAANFLIIILAGAPVLAWVVFMPMLVSQTLFGALSAPIGLYVVQKIARGDLFTETVKSDSSSLSQSEEK